MQGKSMDPNSGSARLEPVFDQTNFQLSALTNPNFLSDAGIVIGELPTVLLPSSHGSETMCFLRHHLLTVSVTHQAQLACACRAAQGPGANSELR